MGMFELHKGKNFCSGSGLAPQTPVALCPIGQERCFWIPRIGVCEVHNSQNDCVGSRVAPHRPEKLFLDT